MKNKDEDKKTYILELNNGNLRRVTVPANWTLTFGPTIPFAGKGSVSPGNGGTALRFYTDKDKKEARAAFTDVRAFRDADIEIEERRTEVQRKVVEQEGPGGMHNVEVEARITQWVNPDTEQSTPNAQPASAHYVGLLNGLAAPARNY